MYQPIDPEVLGDRYLEERAIFRKLAKRAFLRELVTSKSTQKRSSHERSV